jgi:hypothetical protein
LKEKFGMDNTHNRVETERVVSKLKFKTYEINLSISVEIVLRSPMVNSLSRRTRTEK